MLQAFFHAWERQLASVTKDRVVRPFDWGLDWVPAQPARPIATPAVPGTVEGNGSKSGGTEPALLREWVDRVMADTDAFSVDGLKRHWDRLLTLLDRTLTAP